MPLNLFPPRAPIGRANVGGTTVDVLMTPEFARALADLLDRVGGPEGVSTTEIIVRNEQSLEQVQALASLSAFDAPPALSVSGNGYDDSSNQSAIIASLTARVDALTAELSMLRAAPDPAQQIADLYTVMSMQNDKFTPSKNFVTGSRGGNVALASLLVALAKSGLVIDSTVA